MISMLVVVAGLACIVLCPQERGHVHRLTPMPKLEVN